MKIKCYAKLSAEGYFQEISLLDGTEPYNQDTRRIQKINKPSLEQRRNLEMEIERLMTEQIESLLIKYPGLNCFWLFASDGKRIVRQAILSHGIGGNLIPQRWAISAYEDGFYYQFHDEKAIKKFAYEAIPFYLEETAANVLSKLSKKVV